MNKQKTKQKQRASIVTIFINTPPPPGIECDGSRRIAFARMLCDRFASSTIRFLAYDSSDREKSDLKFAVSHGSFNLIYDDAWTMKENGWLWDVQIVVPDRNLVSELNASPKEMRERIQSARFLKCRQLRLREINFMYMPNNIVNAVLKDGLPPNSTAMEGFTGWTRK